MSSGAERILVVDDSSSSLLVLEMLLDGHGYDITTATNGKDALRLARSNPPDLILLDILMPEMDGFEVCRLLKDDERTRSIPVIFLSALEESDDKIKAFQMGSVDYISKPFSAGEVLARIRTHLALRNALERLEEANSFLEQALQRERRLNAFARELNRTLDEGELVRRIAASVPTVLQSDWCDVGVFAPDSHSFQTVLECYRGATPLPLPEGKDLSMLQKASEMTSAALIPETSDPAGETEILLSPLVAGHFVLGALAAYAQSPRRSFTAHDVATGESLARMAAISLENARLFRHTEHLARTDNLTGLPNRLHFFAVAEHERASARRYDTPLSAIMFDLDHFKRINDTYGHLQGDNMLRAVARAARASMREADVLARFGGEEFVVLLPRTSQEQACATAERMRIAVAAARVPLEGENEISITASFGVATLHPAEDATLDSLIDRADRMLYVAKTRGRNQVAGEEATA